MKVSIIHAERRCAQHIALDVLSPAGAILPTMKLRPTERHDLTLSPDKQLTFVASALLKQLGPAPLVIELEAEEGETLTDNTVRAFQLDPPPAYYTEKALEDEKLARLPAPLLLAGSRQQYGLVSVEISPARDVLIAIEYPPPRTVPL